MGDIRCPSTAELISIWESGLGRPGHARALLLLESACPGSPAAELAQWSVGRRDSVLFRLRQMLFGESLNSVARCPGCHAEMELSLTVSDIRGAEESGVRGVVNTGVVNMEGYEVTFRVPDSNDLEAARHEGSIPEARQCLLERCIVKVVPDGPGVLPEAVLAAVAAGIAAADPTADRRLAVVCQECGSTWEEIFDISAWLASEIGTWVRRIVREVHSLALAYGWREEDILAMNPTRRQLYLNMLAQA